MPAMNNVQLTALIILLALVILLPLYLTFEPEIVILHGKHTKVQLWYWSYTVLDNPIDYEEMTIRERECITLLTI